MSDNPDKTLLGAIGRQAKTRARQPLEALVGREQDAIRKAPGAASRRADRKLPHSSVVFRAVKGTICLVPVLQGVDRLYGQFSRFRVHDLGIVTDVASSGAVGGYRCYGAVIPGLWHQVEAVLTDPAQGFLGCYVVPPDRLSVDAEQVLHQLPQRFRSVDDAREALRPHLGNALCPQSVV